MHNPSWSEVSAGSSLDASVIVMPGDPLWALTVRALRVSSQEVYTSFSTSRWARWGWDGAVNYSLSGKVVSLVSQRQVQVQFPLVKPQAGNAQQEGADLRWSSQPLLKAHTGPSSNGGTYSWTVQGGTPAGRGSVYPHLLSVALCKHTVLYTITAAQERDYPHTMGE